ncbi:MAG: MSMEG_1061 family FMN-dependent PPOX-type flavoprotein [Pseudomonadota bacterium]
MTEPHAITDLAALEARYGAVNRNSIAKETKALTPAYRAWIEAAPFFAIATCGAEGLDCSPRGDRVGQLFAVEDDRTLLIPDRRGNNRLDTLKNLIADPRLALLFLVPGVPECVRINGRGTILADPALLTRFTVQESEPATVLRVDIDAVYFQCARAIIRASLWDPDARSAPRSLPSAGKMTRSALPEFDAESYDRALRPRQKSTLY